MEFLDQRIIYILVRGSCEDWEGVRFQPNSICCDEPETTLKSFSALFLLLISACSLNSDVVKVRTAEDIRFADQLWNMMDAERLVGEDEVGFSHGLPQFLGVLDIS